MKIQLSFTKLDIKEICENVKRLTFCFGQCNYFHKSIYVKMQWYNIAILSELINIFKLKKNEGEIKTCFPFGKDKY